jgi:hypothetical protein
MAGETSSREREDVDPDPEQLKRWIRRDLAWLKECRENPDLQIRPLPD